MMPVRGRSSAEGRPGLLSAASPLPAPWSTWARVVDHHFLDDGGPSSLWHGREFDANLRDGRLKYVTIRPKARLPSIPGRTPTPAAGVDRSRPARAAEVGRRGPTQRGLPAIAGSLARPRH